MSYPYANLIIPRLWIGDVKSSEDKNFIKENGIEVVVNCTKNLPHCFEAFSTKEIPNEIVDKYFIKYYRVSCDDNGRESEVENFYNDTKKIINDVLQDYNSGKNILIHCVAGQQRSCSFALCLMNSLGMDKKDAFKKIRENRESSFNFGFEVHFQKAIDNF